MKGKSIFSISIFISIVFLSACGGSIEEKLHANLEEIVEIEESNENVETMKKRTKHC